MPDDQDQKPTTIDDLVKQLSNQGGQKPPLFGTSANQPSSPSAMASQGPPPNLPGIKVEDKPQSSQTRLQPSMTQPQPVPTRPQPSQTWPQPSVPPPVTSVKPPLSAQLPKPPLPPPSKLTIPPPPLPPKPVPPAQEYKSSIRTMGEDISSIKAGQKPSGVDIQRKIGLEQPKVKPEVKKPIIPSPPPPTGGPKPFLGLGRAEKTEPLPSLPIPKKPEIPKPPGIQPSIVVPGEKKGFLSPTLYMLIAGILIVGGFLYWFLVLRVAEPEVIVSPTPSPTQIVTPTPIVKSLAGIFEGESVNFEVLPGENTSKGFKSFVSTLSIVGVGGEFLKVNLSEDIEGTLIPLNLFDMFDVALTTYPSDLRKNTLDSVVLVYGQREMFKADGSISFTGQDLKKTIFVVRVKDGAEAITAMNSWELTIANDLADYLQIDDTTKETSVNFLNNTYQGVSIRYKNFPFPDIAVDHAVVNAEGQSYLVIAGSREAMYATVDALKGKGVKSMKNIVETAIEAGSFKTLVAAVQAAGLVETLSGPGPFTVFAPTDEAFNKLPPGTVANLLKDTAQLTQILTYHVVSGKVMSKDVVNLSSAKTVQGKDISITVSDGEVMVNGAKVIQADIETSNGVIHVIDAVLIP